MRSFSVGLLTVVASASPSALSGADKATVHQWEPYTVTLESAHSSYPNPYADVDLRVSISCVSSSQGNIHTITGFLSSDQVQVKRNTSGYWDGNQTWRFSTFFHQPGQCEWSTQPFWEKNQTVIADEGLTRKGTVTVSKPQHANSADEPNPFIVEGPLRVTESKTHLEFAGSHRDFYWLGDTAWAGPFKSTADDWKMCVDV